jgi:hypothetical protein
MKPITSVIDMTSTTDTINDETLFNREQFEARARAMAPPMPADMSTPRDEVELAAYFWGAFGIVLAIGFVAGMFIDTAAVRLMENFVGAAILGGIVTAIVWVIRRAS